MSTSNTTTADIATELGRHSYLINSMLAKVRTTMPCQIKKVANNGGLSPIGYVDILPLVQQVDGSGVAYDNGIIFNVPYIRIQGGANAVIIDPQVGDIGLAAFCDRDISRVKKTKAQAAPNSRRKHDMSDAVYLGAIIAAAPTQYIQFNDDGITVHSPAKVTVSAPEIDLIAPNVNINASSALAISSPATTISGTLSVQGAISGAGGLAVSGGAGAAVDGTITATGEVTGNGKALSTHTHGGVQGGGGHTAPPD